MKPVTLVVAKLYSWRDSLEANGQLPGCRHWSSGP